MFTVQIFQNGKPYANGDVCFSHDGECYREMSYVELGVYSVSLPRNYAEGTIYLRKEGYEKTHKNGDIIHLSQSFC